MAASSSRRRRRSPVRCAEGEGEGDGDEDEEGEAVQAITPRRRRALSEVSWVDFAESEEVFVDVTTELIPSPRKKPLEVKDRMNPFYGCEVVELCPAINSDFGLDFAEMGVAIWDIEDGSQAQKLGRVGDIIVSVDNQRCRTLKDIESIGDKM